MVQLRVALAQVNPTVGDLAGNTALIRDRAAAAARSGAHVVVFPEMALTGTPVQDLARRATFTEASHARVRELAAELHEAGHGDVLVYVGYLDRDERGPRNAVAALFGGQVHTTQHERTLEVVRLRGADIAVVTSTDLRHDGGRISTIGQAGVDLVVACHAAPYERTDGEQRPRLVARRAAEARAPIACTNLVGGQDELVFDGDSLITSAGGELLARAPRFEESLLLRDLELPAAQQRAPGECAGIPVRRTSAGAEPAASYEPQPAPALAEPPAEEAQMWSALVLGLRDYVRKNGFPATILGFSGGIDSTICAVLAADALGADAVHGVSMPSKYSSGHSRSDAAELAERLGCHFRTENVEDMVAIYVDQLGLRGLAEENIQARVRGMLLMARSNMEGHLVLAPGNKTELAVGYSTIYGDTVGGYAPIKDVFKTQLWRLARWRNEEAARRGETAPIPESSISKQPSAELRPGQVDSDSLPDYTLLDGILQRYIEAEQDYDDLLAGGFDPAVVERVVRMLDGSEYKRRQYPPGPKITSRAFGAGHRLPMTNAWRETHRSR